MRSRISHRYAEGDAVAFSQHRLTHRRKSRGWCHSGPGTGDPRLRTRESEHAMKIKRYELTPQMRDYDAFNNPAHRRYVPYLMYFNQVSFASRSINTDQCGFRISTGPDGSKASAGGRLPPGPLRLVVGGSTALGLGSTSDSTTLPSLLWTRYAPSEPWLNFAAWSFNPTQEF